MSEEKTYYWNSKNRLGSGKKAIKRGDVLPKSYATDPRLKKWFKNGEVSISKPSIASENLDKLGKLQLKNIELRGTIDGLTKQAIQIPKLKEQVNFIDNQNKVLNSRINQALEMKMANEKEISKVISALEEDRVSKDERFAMAETLKNLKKTEAVV